MNTLKSLGLTPEMIARHVVSVDRRPGRPDYCAKKEYRRAEYQRRKQKSYANQEARRAERQRRGLNVLTGLPLQRSPNGTRKPRKMDPNNSTAETPRRGEQKKPSAFSLQTSAFSLSSSASPRLRG